MKFIKLTLMNGQELLLDKNNVESLYEDVHFYFREENKADGQVQATRIVLSSGVAYLVKETMSVVLDKVNENV